MSEENGRFNLFEMLKEIVGAKIWRRKFPVMTQAERDRVRREMLKALGQAKENDGE